MRLLTYLLALFLGMTALCGHASDPVREAPRYAGRYLVAVLEEFRDEGMPVIYSTDLVKPDMRVPVEPDAVTPDQVLREILASLGLDLRRRGSDWLVVPGTGRTTGPAGPRVDEPTAAKQNQIESVLVHASRYDVSDSSPSANNLLAAGDIDQLVGAGREPLRTIGRLPGAATSGLSGKQNIRGGEEDEVLVVFDGVPLFEPFHLKDFQNIFSILDPRVVAGMEVYTGGFPAQYGDRLSGVIDVAVHSPGAAPYHELSLDFFNVGALSSGKYADDTGSWLISARRGNLDLMFDAFNNDIGSPSYYDLLAQTRRRFSESVEWSGNIMLADDAITLNESDRETQAQAEYRTLHVWTALDHSLSEALSHRTILAFVDARNRRDGTVERPAESSGDVNDRREYESLFVKQDWTFAPSDEFLARWGIDLRQVDAWYRYRSDLEFFEEDQLAALTGRTGRNLDLDVAIDGWQAGIYLTNRWRFNPRWTAEIGLRWDKQDFIRSVENEQTSPRFSVMFRPAERTVLRAGWGRFSQAQGVHELQIEDGVTDFAAAQRSAHTVIGIDHRFENDLMLRLEAYRKHMDRLRPRFENLFNQLELLPELSPDRVVLEPDEATAKGVELLLRHDRAGSPIGWWLGASFSSVDDTFDGVEVPRSWDQQRALSLGINWRGGLWRADAVAHYHDGWPTTEVRIDGIGSEATAVLGSRNAVRLPDFFSVDFRVARRKPLPGDKAWTIFFELSNATARDNPCCVDYEIEEGDDDTISVLREFDDWLPIVPSLGIIWEF